MREREEYREGEREREREEERETTERAKWYTNFDHFCYIRKRKDRPFCP